MIEAPLTILVVEDEALLRLLLMEVLEEAGFKVIEACTADDAVLLLDATPDIRLVFTDVDMPGALDGFQLAQYVRDHHSNVGVIIGSGKRHPRPEDIGRGTIFLQKPYSTSVLVKHVRRMTVREQGGSSSPPFPSPVSRP
jgi:DNA-binding response OmpR family regulator